MRSGRLGRLLKKGTRRVRMTKMTSVWVVSDSTNQPERKRRWAGVEDAQHDGEGEEVVDARDRAEEGHEAADQADVPLGGAGEQLLVDVVGRDRHLADVVEEVVEQDLRRQHRQEGEEQGGAGGGEHVAEVGRGAHQHVLDRVGEDAAALDDTVGDDAEVLVEQDDVGGVLGDVGGGVDGDADVGVVEGDRVVDAVAEEADVGAEAALREDDARLLLGGDAGEDRSSAAAARAGRRRPASRARGRSRPFRGRGRPRGRGAPRPGRCRR